jgi:hypothetical protein
LNKLFLCAAIALTASACAKQPDQIAATNIGDDVYARHTCSSLKAENLKQEQSLANLSAEQKAAATGDTVGVLLIGLPTSSMSGNDKEAQIAIVKGRIQAIDRAKAKKGCK